MKNSIFAVTTFLLFFCMAGRMPICLADGWEIEAGAATEYFDYEEPGIMEEKGIQAGLFAALSFRTAQWLWHAYGSGMGGSLKYKGGNSLRTKTFNFNTPNYVYDLRLLAGRMLPLSDSNLIPYLGLGGRFLFNDLPDQGSTKGYKREQTYLYVPIGVRWDTQPAGMNIQTSLEYDLFLRGENRSVGAEMIQNTGYGLRASVRMLSPPLGSQWLSNAIITMEPYVSYWNVADSDWSSAGLYEPKNHSLQAGLRLGLLF